MAAFGDKNKKVKRIGDLDLGMTPEQASEWMKCANDIFYFMSNYMYIQSDRGKVLFDPRPYQKRFIGDCQKNRFVISVQGRQQGKALDVETLIPTPDGYKKLHDIEAGDVVYGKDGGECNVVFATPIMYDHECYRVRFSNGESVIADKDHLWEIGGKKFKGRHVWTTERILNAGVAVGNKGESKFFVDTCEPTKNEEKELDTDPYIFGYWLGDGSSYGGSIYCGCEDIDHITTQLKNNGYEYGDVLEENAVGRCHKLSVRGLHTSEPIKSLCVCKSHKGTGKRIPIEYLRSSFNQRLALLQGLMDSDGSCSTSGTCEITQKSKPLIDDVFELISSLGVRVSTPRKKVVNGACYWRLCFVITRESFPIFRMERKLNRQKKHHDKRRHSSNKKKQISSIERVESVPVKCIQVDSDDHMFLFGRGHTPTHNTITMAAFILHTAIFQPDQRIGLCSYDNDHVKDFLSRIQYAYEEMEWWMKPATKVYNVKNIVFDNNSSVEGVVTKSNSFRGSSVNLLIVDELAFVKPSISEEFLASITPTIEGAGSESDTKMVVISTFNGTAGAFYSMHAAAHAGTNNFIPSDVEYAEVPGRDEEFERTLVPKIGQDRFDQEFKCIPIGSGGTLIRSRVMEAIPTMDPIETDDDLDWYTTDIKGRIIGISCDVAEGVGGRGDFHCMQIFNMNTMEQIGEWANNQKSQKLYLLEIERIINLLFDRGAADVYYTIENNGVGQGLLRLREESTSAALQKATFISDVGENGVSTDKGIRTTKRSKLKGCTELKTLVETGKLTLHSKKLLNELKVFVSKGNSFASDSGHDDRVMALVVLMLLTIELANYEDTVDEVINSVSEEDETFGIDF